MKIVKLTCPVCGANIDADEKMIFCSYCGSKLVIDNEETNINIKYMKFDEARIKESERKEKIRLKELENEQNDKKRDAKIGLLGIGLLIFIMILSLGLSFYYSELEKPNKDEIAIPMASDSYEGNNYQQVLSELENAGFVNIEVKINDDLVIGWITKDGDVERVSINGDYDFDEGDIFPKDAKVIITYHTFKNN